MRAKGQIGERNTRQERKEVKRRRDEWGFDGVGDVMRKSLASALKR
jgi:hypothetical protein